MELPAALAIFVVYLIAQYLDWKWNLRQTNTNRTRKASLFVRTEVKHASRI
jgi:hypothetical protein